MKPKPYMKAMMIPAAMTFFALVAAGGTDAVTSPIVVTEQASLVVPSELRSDANQAFANGSRCFIWKDTNTTIVVEAGPRRGQVIIFGGLSVVANPKETNVLCRASYSFVLQKENDAELREYHGQIKEPVYTVSSKERTLIEVVIPSIAPEVLAGTGVFAISLVEHQTEHQTNSVPISNKVVFTIPGL